MPEAVHQILLVAALVALLSSGAIAAKAQDQTWAVSWHHHTSTTLPLGFGIGYVMLRGSGPPLNLFVSGEWLAYRQFAPVAPQTTVRFGVTVPFPEWRLWD